MEHIEGSENSDLIFQERVKTYFIVNVDVSVSIS